MFETELEEVDYVEPELSSAEMIHKQREAKRAAQAVKDAAGSSGSSGSSPA